MISGKLEDKEYSYSQYLGFVEANKITGEDLETERLAMIQSIFNDKSLFLAATADIIDNPTIYEVDNNQNYVIQHMNVIYYPNNDLEMDADYTDGEPIYYITTIDVKVVKYTDEMYFFDQGFTYETVAKEVKDLQDSIAALQENVEKLEKDNNDLAVTKNEYSEQLAQCKQELNQYTTMYNEMVKELNEYIGSTDVAEDGYFGTKTETKEDGSVDTTNVVWVNGSECVYQKTEDYIEVDGISRNIYSGTGDIDEDGIPDNFKFYVANDGVHVIEKDGEPFEKVYSDPIRALERKLTAQLTSVREQLSGISVKIKALKEALGIDDPDFDDLSSEEQLEIILEKVNDLLSEKANLEKKFTENTKTIADYVDAMDQIYEKLISGNLDETDVSTLQKKLEKILSDIEGIQDENVRLSGRVGELEEEIQTLQEKLDGKDVEIKEKDATIEDLEKNIKELQTNVTNLNKTISEQAGTIQSLESNVSSLTEDNDKLKEEVESLSDDVSSLESSNAEQQERIEGLSELLTEKEEKISEGTATIEDLQNTIAQANLTVKDLKTENEAQAETITSLQNRVSTLSTLSESQESKIKKLSSDINDLKNQNESLDNTITALKKTISEQSTNITELNGTIEKLQTEISGYKNTISDQEKTIASLTESAEGYVLTVNDASDLFGTSKNASAKEVKESINAFVVAKTESENTIKEIQKKLGTNATGNELVALVGKAGKEDSTSASNHTPVPQNTSETTSDNTAYQNLLRDYSILKIENSSLTRDNETLRNENSSLKSDNRDLEKDITALKISSATQTNASGTNVDNTSLASRNTTLERENAVLSSEVASLKDTVKENKESIQSLTVQNTSLTKEMETLKADEKENKEAIQSLKEQNTSLTEKNAGKEKAMPTPMPKVSEKPGISSTLVASDNSGSGNGPGTVITEKLPEKSDASEAEGVNFTPLDTDSSYVGVVTSNGSEDLDTTSDEKENANTVFSHYACNLDALGNLGAEEIMDAMENAGEIVGIKALASIDVVPSSIQDKAIEAGKKLTLNLSSNDFTNGNMYLVVHESKMRDGQFDVSLVKAQDGAIDVELEDLSPVAVAEVTVTKAGTFNGDNEVPEGEIDRMQSSNSGLKIVYIIVAIVALVGAGALLWVMKSGKLKRRYS